MKYAGPQVRVDGLGGGGGGGGCACAHLAARRPVQSDLERE
eukprot:COSAG01_NODE_52799_length_344_cov_0.616327_1_plen_40_part_10